MNITFETLQKKYLKLISDPKTDEEKIHKFFIKYPVFIPLLRPYKNIVFSKFPMGNQYVADFAFARENSTGVTWHFIEIENPRHKHNTKAGNPTKEFTHGIRQLQDWKMWFTNNRPFIRQNFPFKTEMAKYGLSDPELNLIIGRRETVLGNSFLTSAAYVNIGIMSFDNLVHRMTSPAIDLLEPIKVCSFRNNDIETISELNMNVSYSISVNNLRRK